MNTSSRKLLSALLVALSLIAVQGCSLKKGEGPIPEATIAAIDKKFPEEIETFAKDLEKVKMAHKDSVAIAYEQASTLSAQYLNLKVPLKERKEHAKEIVKLLKGVAKVIPEMQKQVKALKTPAAIVPIIPHFIAHLEALKDEALAHCVYAELACSAEDPTKSKKFLDAYHKLNELGNKRQAEIQAFQQGMVSLSVPK